MGNFRRTVSLGSSGAKEFSDWYRVIEADLEKAWDDPAVRRRLRKSVRPGQDAAKRIAATHSVTGKYARVIRVKVANVKRGSRAGVSLGLSVSLARYKDRKDPPKRAVRWGQGFGHEYGNRKFRGGGTQALRRGLLFADEGIRVSVEQELARHLNSRRDRILIKT